MSKELQPTPLPHTTRTPISLASYTLPYTGLIDFAGCFSNICSIECWMGAYFGLLWPRFCPYIWSD